MHFAVIETGGKQYKVSKGTKLPVERLIAEKLPVAEGVSFAFDKVLLVADGEKVTIGTPYITGAKVEAKILKNARTPKKIVFRYHSKTRYRKFNTHRQDFSEVEIINIK